MSNGTDRQKAKKNEFIHTFTLSNIVETIMLKSVKNKQNIIHSPNP